MDGQSRTAMQRRRKLEKLLSGDQWGTSPPAPARNQVEQEETVRRQDSSMMWSSERELVIPKASARFSSPRKRMSSKNSSNNIIN